MGSFARCHELLNVYCYSESIPKTSTSAFYDSYIDYVTLHVPASAIDLYKAASPWDEFKEIVALTDQEMSVDGITGDKKQEVARYAIGGQRIGKDTKGLNIIRMSDGTTKKVVMK